MKKQDQKYAANKVNGLLGTGLLNWLGDFDMETKKQQFNVFFKNESQAIKALQFLAKYGSTKIVKTPKCVNTYFKICVNVIL